MPSQEAGSPSSAPEPEALDFSGSVFSHPERAELDSRIGAGLLDSLPLCDRPMSVEGAMERLRELQASVAKARQGR